MIMGTRCTITGSIVATMMAIASFVVLFAGQAWAAESASFRLYTEHPNDADGGPKQSTSFKMDEGKMTWRKFPLVSTSFQLVTAPPVVISEGGSSGGGNDSGGGSGGGGGGGRRGRTPILPKREPFPGGPGTVPDEPMRPAAPGRPVHPVVPGGREPIPATPDVPPLPLVFRGGIVVDLPVQDLAAQGAAYPGERLISRVHFFHIIDSFRPSAPVQVPWPVLYEQFRFTARDYVLFMLNAIILSIFFSLFVGARRGLIVQYAPVYRMRSGRWRFPLFILLHGKAKSTFIIRDLYPRCSKRNRAKQLRQS